MNVAVPFLTNLAPSTKRAAAITASAAAASVALLFLAVLPARVLLRSVKAEIATLNDSIAKMRADIAGTEQQKAKTDAAVARLDALTAAGAIEPLLGSYAMQGKSLLAPLALESGFTVESVRELPGLALQMPKPAPEQLYLRQPVEFTGHGSYDQIAAFIARAEASLPMATLSGLLILSQPQTPETHKALITFEWPAKGEKRLPPATVTTGK